MPKKLSAEHRARISESLRRTYGNQPDHCSVEGCANPRDSLGLCSTHRRRFKLYGDPHYLLDRTGPKNPNWQGGKTHHSIHDRARRALPRECALADETCKGRLEAAFRWHDTPEEFWLPGRTGPYSPDLAHYWRLCRSHHVRYDHRKLDLGDSHG